MPFDLGILSDAALTGLSAEEKDSLQRQATKQFLLGSVLGGDPSVGFKSAIGVPEQYTSAQKNILDMAEKKRNRDQLSSFMAQFAPTLDQAGQRALAEGGEGPTIEAAQNQQAILNAPIDYQRALTESLRLVGNPAQPQIRETLGAMQNKVQGNLILNPNQQVIGGIPSFDPKSGLVTNPSVKDGNVTFNVSNAPGFAGATARNTLPPLSAGQEYTFDRSGNVSGIKNVDGSIQSLTEATLAKARAEGKARLETTPTNVLQPSTGRTVRTTEAQAIGQPTALSPSEVQAFEGYKQIRDAAFLGAESAKAADISMQNLQNILNRGNFKPGKFAGAQSEIASIATGLGIGGEKARLMATDSTLTLQAVSDITASRLKEMAGAISNADVTFSAGRGPQIKNTEEAMQYYIDLNTVVNKRKKDYSNYVNKNAVPDVAERWSQTTQGSSSVYEDPKLRKYLPSGVVTGGPDKGKKAYLLPTGQYKVFD